MAYPNSLPASFWSTRLWSAPNAGILLESRSEAISGNCCDIAVLWLPAIWRWELSERLGREGYRGIAAGWLKYVAKSKSAGQRALDEYGK